MKFTTGRAIGALVLSMLVVGVFEGMFGPDDGLSSASLAFSSMAALLVGYWVARSRETSKTDENETS